MREAKHVTMPFELHRMVVLLTDITSQVKDYITSPLQLANSSGHCFNCSPLNSKDFLACTILIISEPYAMQRCKD